jgi:hypothetical protein
LPISLDIDRKQEAPSGVMECWSDGEKANATWFPILQYSNTSVLQFSMDYKDTRRNP